MVRNDADSGAPVSNGPGPLTGVTVIDLTHVLAGPYATMLLADLGARVLKVEPPLHGDTSRHTPPFRDGVSHFFAAVNRNKSSVAIDLKRAEGVEMLRTLAESADVLVHNFRPTVMEKLGLGYETLRRRNQKLIYCEITGFGTSGPLSQRPAFDLTVQAMTGLMAMTGQPDDPPIRPGISVADLAAGVFGAFAILAALTYREKSGHGQLVDVSMFDCVFNLLTYNLTYVQATGREPGRSGGRHPTIVPMGCFTTMDGFIVIAAFNNNFWLNLCDAVGKPEWREDSRFIRMRDRAAHRAELFAELDELLARKTTREWEEVFSRADVPFGPVWSVGDLLAQPHVSARRLLEDVYAGHEAGEVNPWQVAVRPVKYSAFDSGVRKQPPRLGEDTSRVLAGMLGLSEREVSELAARGIIGINESRGQ